MIPDLGYERFEIAGCYIEDDQTLYQSVDRAHNKSDVQFWGVYGRVKVKDFLELSHIADFDTLNDAQTFAELIANDRPIDDLSKDLA